MTQQRLRKRFFERLKESLEDGIRHARGEIELNSYELVAPDKPPAMDASEVLALRRQLRVSTSEFALLINVPIRTVMLWEAGKRKPSGAAARLLQVYAGRPDVVDFLTNGQNGTPAVAKRRKPARSKA